MGHHNDDSSADEKGMKSLDDLASRLQGIDPDQIGDEMKSLMNTLVARGSEVDIEAMKKIGREFETLSQNLLNLADLIDRKFKIN